MVLDPAFILGWGTIPRLGIWWVIGGTAIARGAAVARIWRAGRWRERSV